ncbi:hypothetical protein GCM10027402_09770 [Arthrobacter monumenti]
MIGAAQGEPPSAALARTDVSVASVAELPNMYPPYPGARRSREKNVRMWMAKPEWQVVEDE